MTSQERTDRPASVPGLGVLPPKPSGPPGLHPATQTASNQRSRSAVRTDIAAGASSFERPATVLRRWSVAELIAQAAPARMHIGIGGA